MEQYLTDIFKEHTIGIQINKKNEDLIFTVKNYLDKTSLCWDEIQLIDSYFREFYPTYNVKFFIKQSIEELEVVTVKWCKSFGSYNY